jgi:hypothetical protein
VALDVHPYIYEYNRRQNFASKYNENDIYGDIYIFGDLNVVLFLPHVRGDASAEMDRSIEVCARRAIALKKPCHLAIKATAFSEGCAMQKILAKRERLATIPA